MSDKTPLVKTNTYVLNAIQYVPHFRNKKLFVGPGYPRFNQTLLTEDALVNAGARLVETFLWSRGEHGIVTNANL